MSLVMPFCLKDPALPLHMHGQHLLRLNILSASRIQMVSPASVKVSCCTQHSNTHVCFHNAGISEAQSNVDRLRQILESVTTGVQEGRAEQQHQRQLALSRRQKPVSYSPWLSQPFLKVCSSSVFCCCPWPCRHPQEKVLRQNTTCPAHIACPGVYWLSCISCLACS